MNTEPIPAGYNRLWREKSPYLRQHASNPVNWYPWGKEAFRAAREQDKPLLISIGYSTCHWCHVMERESFSQPDTAKIMNDNFICVKVDREERPDIDKIYMNAVQAMTGSGGWPLNCFVTPQGKPFYGGTYFPPQGAFGRPGWEELLLGLAAAWKDPVKRAQIDSAGGKLLLAIEKMGGLNGEVSKALSGVWINQAIESYEKSYDAKWGGFSPAPKFPMPVNFHFLFRAWQREKSRGQLSSAARILEISSQSLKKMAAGGIYDHVAGGFARYSTDERWHVPHFEKMLYDNAQLALVYLEAWQVTGKDLFLRIAEETLRYIQRDMTSPQGGFYSAEDADSLPWELAHKYGDTKNHEHKVEGAFYVWEKSEIKDILGEEAAWFNSVFGVTEAGNVRSDPHGEFKNKNVLFRSFEEIDSNLHSPLKVAAALKKLRIARGKRPRPQRDEKILASWNGLMISAFAKAYTLTGKGEYLKSALKAANFIKDKMYEKGCLYRRYAEGERLIHGNSDDYAAMTAAAIDLYEASFDETWLAWAIELADKTQSLFYDLDQGGYYMTAKNHDPLLPMRMKDTQDNVEPAPASIAAMNNLRLWLLADRSDLRDAAEETLKAFGQSLSDSPRALPRMLSAVNFALEKPIHVIVVGKKSGTDTAAMLTALRRPFIPNKVMALIDPTTKKSGVSLPFAEKFSMLKSKATAYICVDFSCSLPTSDPTEAALLAGKTSFAEENK